MHKHMEIKGYDQSGTCLADGLKTLVTRSSTLHTPETLSQTNNSIHKHSSNVCKGKTQDRISKLKLQEKSFDLQKESIESSCETQTTFKRSSKTNLLETNFKLSKSCSS